MQEYCTQYHLDCSTTATMFFTKLKMKSLQSHSFGVVFGQTEGTRSGGMTAVESVLLTEMLL